MSIDVLKMLGLSACLQSAAGDAEIAGHGAGIFSTSFLQLFASNDESSTFAHNLYDEEPSHPHDANSTDSSDPPSSLDNDIQWAISVAVNEIRSGAQKPSRKVMKGDHDEQNSIDLKSHSKMRRRTKSEVPEVKSWEDFGFKEALPSPDLSRDAREKEMLLFLILMPSKGFPSGHINSQLKKDWKDLCLFCTLLPEYFEFERDTLVQLWMAGVTDDGPYVECDAKCYFDALVADGCIQEAGICFPTGNTKYKLDPTRLNRPTAVDMWRYLMTSRTDSLTRAYLGLEHLSVEFDDINEEDFDRIKIFKYLKTLMFHSKFAGNELQQKYTTTAFSTKIVKIPSHLFTALTLLCVAQNLAFVPKELVWR